MAAKEKKYDISYRASDEMFTIFLPNTPAGLNAWKVIAAQNGGTGTVLTIHAKNTISQLRDAGYTVAKSKPSDIYDISDDDLMAKLMS